MNRLAVPGWSSLSACASKWQMCATLSRLLLMLAAVEVITMPLTQHLWTWDHFLHGGQDFELGLLTIVTCLCLVLLHAQRCSQNVDLVISLRSLLQRAFGNAPPLTMSPGAGIVCSLPARLQGPGSGMYFAPLQI